MVKKSEQIEWVLVTYRIPRNPSAPRVFIWRRLRRLGAVLLHGSVWALPRTPYTQEQAQWLASEIEQLKGDANVWIASAFPAAADAALVREFTERSDRAFQQIAERARRPSRNTDALARDFRDAVQQDYFHSAFREAAHAALRAAPEPAKKHKAPTRRKKP